MMIWLHLIYRTHPTSPSRVLPKLQPPKGDVGPSAVHPAQQRTAMAMPANELQEVVVDEVNQRRVQNPIRILLSNRRTSIIFHKAALSLLPFLEWVMMATFLQHFGEIRILPASLLCSRSLPTPCVNRVMNPKGSKRETNGRCTLTVITIAR